MKDINLEHVFGNNWREHFLDKEVIADILSAVDVKHLHFKDIAKQYLIDDDRVSVIATMEDEDKHLQQAIIDVKTGFPTWEQMMDVIYTTGEGCETKIVVFDGTEKEDEDNNLGIGCGFLEMLIDSGLQLDILMIDKLVNTATGKRLSYKLIDKPRASDKKLYPPVPSRWEAAKISI